MPELPEVENVRRSLAPHLLDQTILSVRVFRPDVIQGPQMPADLLQGQRITRIDRRGKQLALVTDAGRVLLVHLGMTGSLRFTLSPTPVLRSSPRRASQGRVQDRVQAQNEALLPHTHLTWSLPAGLLHFRDPRRFGGLWTFPTEAHLHEYHWSRLGEDALTIAPADLHRALAHTRRPLKAALLDQALLAGLGNIYVDELLYACRWSPLRPAHTLTPADTRSLVRRMRVLLIRAIGAGGSTLRDYADGNGDAGGFQLRHQVYGRVGQPCRRCRTPLASLTIIGRTTVSCPRCQPRPRASS